MVCCDSPMNRNNPSERMSLTFAKRYRGSTRESLGTIDSDHGLSGVASEEVIHPVWGFRNRTAGVIRAGVTLEAELEVIDGESANCYAVVK